MGGVVVGSTSPAPERVLSGLGSAVRYHCPSRVECTVMGNLRVDGPHTRFASGTLCHLPRHRGRWPQASREMANCLHTACTVSEVQAQELAAATAEPDQVYVQYPKK